MESDGQLLTAGEVAAWLGVADATLSDWRVNGTGPPYVKLGPGRNAAVRYARSDVQAWIDRAREASA